MLKIQYVCNIQQHFYYILVHLLGKWTSMYTIHRINSEYNNHCYTRSLSIKISSVYLYIENKFRFFRFLFYQSFVFLNIKDCSYGIHVTLTVSRFLHKIIKIYCGCTVCNKANGFFHENGKLVF